MHPDDTESFENATPAPPTNPRRRMKPAQLDRLPPHSFEAEQGVLACILLSPNPCMGEAMAVLPWAEAFYDLRHQRIYTSMMAMFQEGAPIDLITLQQHLKDNGKLEEIGGLAYLATLPDTAPSSANLSYYVGIVRDKYALRKSISFCTEHIGRVYEYEGQVDQALDDFERGALSVRKSIIEQSNNGFVDIAKLQGELEDSYSAALMTKERPGIQTGYADLDSIIGGLIAPDVFILAARPSVGKTSFAMNIVENVSVRNRFVGGIFSLEMSAKQLLHRMACSIGKANGQKIMRGTFDNEDSVKLAAGHAKLNAARKRIVICDKGGLTVFQLAAAARQMVSRMGVQYIVIDYLQLLNAGKRVGSRNEEVTFVSNSIKSLAKELNVPIILISQLTRMNDREGRAPRMSDLRDSGCVTGDTRIYSPHHTSRIDELIIDTESKSSIFTVDMNSDTIIGECRKVWITGSKQVFEMRLDTGHSIKATGNHKFLNAEGSWRKLEDMKPGDLVAIAMNAECESGDRKELITPAEARLLGLFVSNGCALPRRSLQITLNAKDRDLAEIAIEDSRSVFGSKLRPYSKVYYMRKKDSALYVFFPSTRIPTHNYHNPMIEWLEKHSLYGKRAKEKSVPRLMFSQNKHIIATFLSALFAGDGTTGIRNMKKNPNKHSYNVASYSTSSEKLANEVQWLLQCLGVVSGITKVNCRGFVSYIVSVRSRSSHFAYAEHIGFLSDRKQKTMSGVVKALKAAPLGYEKYVISDDLCFVPIKSITPCGERLVYDAEVCETHNFIANGIVAHNSLEQDADIIGLLYPDESKNGSSDQVKLAIPKHRNGQVGMVRLLWFKEWVRFETQSKIAEEDVPAYEPDEPQVNMPLDEEAN